MKHMKNRGGDDGIAHGNHKRAQKMKQVFLKKNV